MPSRISVLSILFDIGGDTESRISAVKTPLITYKLNNKSTTQTTFAVMFIDSISVTSFTSVLLLSLLLSASGMMSYNALSSNVGQINSTRNHTFQKCLRLRKTRL